MSETKSLKKLNGYIEKRQFTGGVRNWALTLFLVACIHIALDNYLQYGILKTVPEFIFDYIQFLKARWWVYVLIYSGYSLQVILMFLIEKGLARSTISESLGMALHTFNTMFLLNIVAAILLTYNIYGIGAFKLSGRPFFFFFKCLSFVYENKANRDKIKNQKEALHQTVKEKDPNKKEKLLDYPQNVTFKNIAHFMFCTGSLIYKFEEPKRLKFSWKNFVKTIALAAVLNYFAGFVIYQYLLPELEVFANAISNQHYVKALSMFFKLLIPSNFVWLLHHYGYIFWCHLPFLANIFDTDTDTIFTKDWWNAENVSVYWIKWNFQVHLCIKNYFMKPVIRMGYSTGIALFFAYFASGIVHEYLNNLPFRTPLGYSTVMMLMQIPLSSMSASVQKRWGDTWGNVTIIIILLIEQIFFVTSLYWQYFVD